MRVRLSAAVLLVVAATPALATEGGTGHYLLGSRDALSGIVPPPGTYVSTDFVYLNASVDLLSIGGVVLANASTEALVTKLSMTRSFREKILGGRLMVSVTQPVVTGSLTFDSIVLGSNRRVKDSQTGLGDTTITTGLGWDEGMNHFSLQTSYFLPLGFFEPARINVATLDLQALSFGKNRFGFTPVIAYTFLSPKTGRELSVATGVSFSARNNATDYQTAPEWHLEAAALQRLPSGLAFGLAGYAYAQLGEDSGKGAAQLRAALGAQSLKARVFGIGPLASWQTKFSNGTSLTLKAKYTHEFEARRRMSGDVVQIGAALGF